MDERARRAVGRLRGLAGRRDSPPPSEDPEPSPEPPPAPPPEAPAPPPPAPPESRAHELEREVAGEAHRAEEAVRDRVRDLVPLAIVIVSVLAAIMGWRASLADETAVHAEELSRQDLVQQQQLDLRDTQQVDADVRTFGTYAEDSLLSHALARDARKLSGQIAESLSNEAQTYVGISRSLGRDIGYTYPAAVPFVRADGTYNATKGSAIRPDLVLDSLESGDLDLHGLDPERLTAEADTNRSKGLHLEGIAALFVASLVFFTLAAVQRMGRTRLFAGSGVVVAVAAVLLFVIVEFS